jgi:3-oxoacyl-[acyl-carrier-protein] synthase-1
MNTPALYVAGAGLACPVGERLVTALAAIRAGVTRFEVVEGREVKASRLSTLAADASRSERTLGLAQRALTDLLANVRAPGLAQLPVFLALPEAVGAPYDEAALLMSVRDRLTRAIGAQIVLNDGSLRRCGREGLFWALQQAAATLSGGGASYAVVGAIDSLVDPDSIDHLSERGLLLDSRNLDGRIPGEAAVFLLVGRPDALVRIPRVGVVSALGSDSDSECFDGYLAGETVNRASALTRIFRNLRRGCSYRMDVVVSGQPGESFWGREFSYAYLRNVDAMPEPLAFLACGTEVGDVGAAAGGVALCRALGELGPSKDAARCLRDTALVYAASDRGEVGACVVRSVRATS